MIGRPIWIAIWWAILGLGILGCVASVHWGRRTAWRNLDEVFRANGTILVSVGMLLLLYQKGGWAGQVLLLAAVVCFVMAIVYGRKPPSEQESP